MTADADKTRLNKFLALHMGISRRQADDLISEGKVAINGRIAPLGARLDYNDVVEVNGKTIEAKTEFVYLVLNKPVGYVSSRKRQGETPTIYELIPEKYHHLKPVGRLDKDSSGLLLLTNDGDFAFQMTHPSFTKVKVYEITLDTDLEPLHQQMISDYGVSLEDGVSQFQVTRINESDRKNWIVTMHQGRNRQIRRTFAALGYMVIRLNRTNFGNYALGDIRPGGYRVIKK